jgi:hypothetical protein
METALSLTILLGFTMGLIQVCLYAYTYQYISELAREGTRYAIFHGPNCETTASASCSASAAQVNSYVTGLKWPNLGGGTVTVNTTYPGTGNLDDQPVKVTVTYAYPFHIPFLAYKTITMTSSSQMDIIQ